MKLKTNKGALRAPLITLALVLSSLGSCVLYTHEGPDGALHNLQKACNQLSLPFQFVSALGGKASSSVEQTLSNATADPQTLSGLKEQNNELRKTIAQLEEYRQEAQRLQGLLKLRDTFGIEGVTCRVIGRNPDSWSQVLDLDQGSNAGIKIGLPVMAPDGMVGQVISVSPSSSRVRLITDHQSGIAVMVQSTRAEGILRGSFEGLLYLENLPADSQVKEGDVVMTSGLGGSVFRGLLIGTVAKIEENSSDGTRRIIVVPNARPAFLEELMVVTGLKEPMKIAEGAAAKPGQSQKKPGQGAGAASLSRSASSNAGSGSESVSSGSASQPKPQDSDNQEGGE